MKSINMYALTQEANNAVQLAESGLKLLEEMKDQHYDSAGMFACLALAAEKLIKIAYGLGTYHETGEWPAKKIREFSHKIDELEPEARRFITSHLETERKKALAGWVRQVEAQTWLSDLFSILKNYGSGGRFYYLDAVIGESKYPAPEDQWSELEDEVCEIPIGIPMDQFEVHLAERRTAIAQAYRDWWTMYESAWIHGAFGPTGKQLSASIPISYPGSATRNYLTKRGAELSKA